MTIRRREHTTREHHRRGPDAGHRAVPHDGHRHAEHGGHRDGR